MASTPAVQIALALGYAWSTAVAVSRERRASGEHRQRGDESAQAIQLHMVYAPEPPFDSGTPETAPAAILEQARQSVRAITAQREQTARRIAGKLGIAIPVARGGASPH